MTRSARLAGTGVPRRVESVGDALEKADGHGLDQVVPLGEIVGEVLLAHLRAPGDLDLRQPLNAVLLQDGHRANGLGRFVGSASAAVPRAPSASLAGMPRGETRRRAIG